MKAMTHDIQGKLAEYVKYLNERLHNVKLIKACCSEKYEIKKSEGYLNEIFKCYKKAIKLDSLVSPLMEICSAIAVALIITYGGYSIVNHTSTPGSLFAFISAFIVAYKPIKSIASMNMILQAGIASAKRILATLDKKNVVENNKDKAALTVKEGRIEFIDVYFSYHDKKQVLQDLSLKIEPNQVVAIVGESGSGKSTLIDLLLKFYEPTSGHIYIDNQDLGTRSTTSIRHNIALVPQDAMLFDSSIRENISYGDGQAVTPKQIYDAAAVANAKEFIKSMPQQYDTLVGKFGIKLSGGQRQRIAIARAVLTKAPILILDEATSSLDQVSEQHVKNSIFALKSRCKAIIIVTHRLSTIVSSDVIHVMKNGRVVESGTHQNLLSRAGEYYRLYHKKILV
jgi:subfamily B ATP-binding cassette protein MsbA